MSSRLKKKQEKIQENLFELAEESATGTPIIVEGKKDVVTLRRLGIIGPILTFKAGGKSLLKAVQEIEQTGAEEIVLLLDFDRRGKEGTIQLKSNLERLRIKPNLRFWFALSALVGHDLQCIEGLASYMQTLESKAK